MMTEEQNHQERSARATLRTIAALIEERTSDRACVQDISYLLSLSGIFVNYRPLDDFKP